jgi:hypothetical protein
MITDNDLINSLQTESMNFYAESPNVNPHHRTTVNPNIPKTSQTRNDFKGVTPIDQNTVNSNDFADTFAQGDSLYEEVKQQIKNKAINSKKPAVTNTKTKLSDHSVPEAIDELEYAVEDIQEHLYKQQLIAVSNLRKATSCETCIYLCNCACSVLNVCVSRDDLCDNYVSRSEQGNIKRQELLQRFNLVSYTEEMSESGSNSDKLSEETSSDYSENNNIVAPEQITNDSNDINKEDIEGLLTYSDPVLWNESVSEITNLDIPLEEKAVRLTTSYINKYTEKYGTKEGAYKKI